MNQSLDACWSELEFIVSNWGAFPRAAVVLKARDQRGFQDIEKVMRILASERNSAGDARFGPSPQAQKWRLPGENREKKTARLELKLLKIRTQTTCKGACGDCRHRTVFQDVVTSSDGYDTEAVYTWPQLLPEVCAARKSAFQRRTV